MPQVSRNKLEPREEQELKEALNLVLAGISKRDEMIKFINSLLTDTEKLMLAKRLAIIVLIKEDLKDSEISKSLNVTEMTVSKFRYFYEARAKEGYDIALHKIENDRFLQGVKRVILALADYGIRAAGGYVRPTILDPKILKGKKTLL